MSRVMTIPLVAIPLSLVGVLFLVWLLGFSINLLTLLAMVFLLVGFAFKVAAVPFHMWTPDAYQGAPTSVTGFMSAGAKAAGFAALLRIVMRALPTLQHDWQPLLAVIAILTGETITVLVGAILAVIAIIPNVISSELEIPPQVASFYGGTGLLIVISVALDLVQKINSHLVMRNYPGLTDD